MTRVINEREELFGFDVTKFEALVTVQMDLEPFAQVKIVAFCVEIC